MKKIHLLWLALVAVCAFGAVGTASAVAEEPGQWLENGALIAVKAPATTEGELLFWDLLTSVFEPQFLCSGIFIGTVGPDAEDEVIEVLDLSLKPIAEGDPGTSGTGIPCTVEKTCETAEVWPSGLPWLSQVDLIGVEQYEDLVVAEHRPAYFLLCRAALIDNTELCETQEGDGVELLNGATHVEIEPGLTLLEALCGGEEMGALEVDTALIFLNNGMSLSVSE